MRDKCKHCKGKEDYEEIIGIIVDKSSATEPAPIYDRYPEQIQETLDLINKLDNQPKIEVRKSWLATLLDFKP